METQTRSVHGHEVIGLLHRAWPPLTMADLEAQVRRKFGANVTFHTCSMQGLSLRQLVTFLIEMGKVTDQGGRLRVDMSQVCADGGGTAEHEHD